MHCLTARNYYMHLLLGIHLIPLNFLHFIQCDDFNFDKTYFGVTFTPFVKQRSNNREESINRQTYTYENIKTMMTLISTKFSQVITTEIGALSNGGSYTYNYTYYHHSLASVYSGEIAARINRENGKRKLTLILGAWQYYSSQLMDIELQLAFESAEKANAIYPKTVVGIAFDKSGTIELAQKTLHTLRAFKKKAEQLKLKLAVEQNCYSEQTFDNSSFGNTQREIMLLSDIIICDAMSSIKNGPERAFNSISHYTLIASSKFKQINSNAKVIVTSLWSSRGLHNYETAEDLRRFWKIASLWATANNFSVYMAEAFDNPSRDTYAPSLAHMGWWKLHDNAQINLVDGYIEKGSGSEKINKTREEDKARPGGSSDKNNTGWSEATTVLAIIGGLVVIIGLAIFLALLFRKKEYPCALSQKEIDNFLYGVSNLFTGAGSAEAAVENALNGPYDSSLEIPKDKLIIEHDHILGSGQFGNVFRAQIKVAGQNVFKEVALKVGKFNAPVTGLKGLLYEIKIMTYLGKHANIVSLEGAYTAELSDGIVYVATELCSLGSLQSFLRNNSATADVVTSAYRNVEETALGTTTQLTISDPDLLRWCHEIACGMEHLERKHVVHADLATRNVLLGSDKTARIADFGLSRRMYNYMDYVKTAEDPLPWRWMAVESLRRLEFSSKSDVWSYGVTVWEIYSGGDTPYPGRVYSEDFINGLVDGARPKRPPTACSQIHKIMERCWRLDPNERPDFADLVLCIGEMRSDTRCHHDNALYSNV